MENFLQHFVREKRGGNCGGLWKTCGKLSVSPAHPRQKVFHPIVENLWKTRSRLFVPSSLSKSFPQRPTTFSTDCGKLSVAPVQARVLPSTHTRRVSQATAPCSFRVLSVPLPASPRCPSRGRNASFSLGEQKGRRRNEQGARGGRNGGEPLDEKGIERVLPLLKPPFTTPRRFR